MDIQVEGHHNRVAGRDYLELNAQVSLTPEQLRLLAVKTCSSCEMRLVVAEKQICNHCLRERAADDLRFKISLFLFVVFMVWGWLLKLRGPDVNLEQFVETFFCAGVIVFLGTLLLEIFKVWWVCYSTEFFAGVWRGLGRLVLGK